MSAMLNERSALRSKRPSSRSSVISSSTHSLADGGERIEIHIEPPPAEEYAGCVLLVDGEILERKGKRVRVEANFFHGDAEPELGGAALLQLGAHDRRENEKPHDGIQYGQDSDDPDRTLELGRRLHGCRLKAAGTAGNVGDGVGTVLIETWSLLLRRFPLSKPPHVSWNCWPTLSE